MLCDDANFHVISMTINNINCDKCLVQSSILEANFVLSRKLPLIVVK